MSKGGIQAVEWILSHMLEISHARGFNRAPRRPPAVPERALRLQEISGRPPGVVKITPLCKKKLFFFNIEYLK